MTQYNYAFLEYNNGLPFDDFCYISQYPLQERGYKILPVHKYMDGYTKLRFCTKNDIAIGSVEFCTKYFKHLNINPPKYIGYPDSIQEFLNREIWESSLKEIEEQNEFPLFVKPRDTVKLFTGLVLESQKDIDLLKLYNSSITDETKLFCSEVINIHSEYRVFVHTKPDGYIIKDKIVGIKHYAGNYKIFPFAENIQRIYEIIESYTNSPICYALDVGIEQNFEKSTLHLIEINDFWALGSYGLDGKNYVKLYLDRHREILQR